MKSNKKIMQFIRRLIQVIFFIFFPSLFILIFQSIKAIFIFEVHGTGSFNSIVLNIILLAGVTLVTIIAGRFFCGWMCAFGSMGDFIYGVTHLKKKNAKNHMNYIDKYLKLIKYLFLLFIVLWIWILEIVAIPSSFNSWELFGIMASIGKWSDLNEIIQNYIPAMIILIALIVASAFIERFFCRYLCPLGAYFGLISKFRQIYIAKDEEICGSCTYCTQKCSMGIDLRETKKVKSAECIDCMECITVCPKSNAHLEINSKTVNVAAAGVITCGLITGAYYLGTYFDGNISSTITSTENSGIAADIEDGTYEGTGTGYRGTTTVEVVVEDGLITNITIESTGDDDQYINRTSSLISEIISTQSTDVDAVTGATYSSEGIIDAVEDALNNAEEETTTEETTTEETTTEETTTEEETTEETTTTTSSGNYSDIEDGTYEGSGTGFHGGTTTVSVVVKNGEITSITIESYEDDTPYFNRAKSTVISEIIDEQSTNVDTVSGATYSSNGIISAVEDALGL